jgi:WD40 repeat protein
MTYGALRASVDSSCSSSPVRSKSYLHRPSHEPVKHSWANIVDRRRIGRTSENDRPTLDIYAEGDLDTKPAIHRPAFLRRSRLSRQDDRHEPTLDHGYAALRGSSSSASPVRCQQADLDVKFALPTFVAKLLTPKDVPVASVASRATHLDGQEDLNTKHAAIALPSPSTDQTELSKKTCRPLVKQRSTIDRFIPPRRNVEHMRNLLKIGKKPSELTARQKALRRTTEPSPFSASSPLRNTSLEYVRAQHAQRHARLTSQRHGRVLLDRPELEDNVANGRPVTWDRHGSVSSIRAAARSAMPDGGHSDLGNHERSVTSRFLYGPLASDETDTYEQRVALALGVDRANRLFDMQPVASEVQCFPLWQNNAWNLPPTTSDTKRTTKTAQVVPRLPFRVLEAPGLRDDFYCSALAYCPTVQSLAVALGSKVYLWSDTRGITQPPHSIDIGRARMNYVTCLAFSSVQGGKALLAIGRGDGQIDMYSPLDDPPRFLRITAPTSVTHLSFRPRITRRESLRHSSAISHQEILLVGDEAGLVSIYFVEWPGDKERSQLHWHGNARLHTRVAIHTQQICGISWSPDGSVFATGGNDNLCCLFSMREILQLRGPTLNTETQVIQRGDDDSVFIRVTSPPILRGTGVPNYDDAMHVWHLGAAVKAIAFCPWQTGLMAAGGGSNDRCIHFYHTISGVTLATIDCGAQITSLIWSQTRREIAATFGFAQPEHPIRIAVYSWPDCQLTAAIPWNPELRALYAIAFPGSSRRRGNGGWTASDEEGCIVVAGSDGSIKFHKIWSNSKRNVGPRRGLLGGSDILESLHGFDKEGGECIR